MMIKHVSNALKEIWFTFLVIMLFNSGYAETIFMAALDFSPITTSTVTNVFDLEL